MIAYKIWHDTKHFIHKDTTDEANVIWTTNIDDALDADNLDFGTWLPPMAKAVRFFHETLGFSLNINKPDALYYL